MPSAFIIQTLLNTLHCRSHCSFCRTGEEGNCVKYLVVAPGRLSVLLLPGAALPRAQVLSLQYHTWPGSLGRCWGDAQGHLCVWAVPWSSGSHCLLGNRLRLVFPRAPLSILNSIVAGGWFVCLFSAEGTAAEVSYSHSTHRGTERVCPPTSQTGANSMVWL